MPLDIINDIPYLIEDGSYSVERDPVELAALCGVFLTDDGVQLCTNGFIPNDCAPCSQNNDTIEVCEVGVQCDEYERYSKQDEVNNRDIFWHKNEACPAKKKENLPTSEELLQMLSERPGWHMRGDVPYIVEALPKKRRMPECKYSSTKYPFRSIVIFTDGEWKWLEKVNQ